MGKGVMAMRNMEATEDCRNSLERSYGRVFRAHQISRANGLADAVGLITNLYV